MSLLICWLCRSLCADQERYAKRSHEILSPIAGPTVDPCAAWTLATLPSHHAAFSCRFSPLLCTKSCWRAQSMSGLGRSVTLSLPRLTARPGLWRVRIGSCSLRKSHRSGTEHFRVRQVCSRSSTLRLIHILPSGSWGSYPVQDFVAGWPCVLELFDRFLARSIGSSVGHPWALPCQPREFPP